MINGGLPPLAQAVYKLPDFGPILLYGDVVHVSSCSLVHVHWHECVATVLNFYTEDANARLMAN
jgi:hypothetical protein